MQEDEFRALQVRIPPPPRYHQIKALSQQLGNTWDPSNPKPILKQLQTTALSTP